MGLVEVLVAGALLAIVAVAMAQLFTGLTKATKHTKQSGEFLEATNSARMVVLNSDLCRHNVAFNGATPRSFSASAAATTVFALDALRLYDAAGNPGPEILKASATDPRTELWIDSIQLRDFFRIDDDNYAAKLRVHAARTQGTNITGGMGRDYQLLLRTATAGGTVTLNQCLPAGTMNMTCQTLRIGAPYNAPSGGLIGTCPSPTQVITGCTAIASPNGKVVCNTTPMAGRDGSGRAFCITDACTAVATQFWNLVYTCCDIFPSS